MITGFNLVLMSKDGQSVLADPKCFFLPFYINQDGSWQAGWGTFLGLQQFRSPVTPILEYFSGIKPPEYYEAKLSPSVIREGLKQIELWKANKLCSADYIESWLVIPPRPSSARRQSAGGSII
jgi:hypothetical protein